MLNCPLGAVREVSSYILSTTLFRLIEVSIEFLAKVSGHSSGEILGISESRY